MGRNYFRQGSSVAIALEKTHAIGHNLLQDVTPAEEKVTSPCKRMEEEAERSGEPKI